MYKKVLLSTFVLGTFAAYSLHLKFDVEEHAPVALITPMASISPGKSTEPVATGPTPPRPVKTVGPTPIPRGQYKDGTYTGPVADAFYGPVQVKVIITGGKITDVQFLQYPSDRQTSVEINQQAMPFLKQEAIQAQSARVDGVSGATQTSRAFIESLSSALTQAS